MAFKDTLPTIDFYTEFDPYVYNVDNRPLVDLGQRDDAIADELDKRVQLVDITGDPTPVTNELPAGWSILRNGDGDYTITHSMGVTSYGVLGSCTHATLPYVFFVYDVSLNSFSVKTVSLAGAATDTRFTCIVSKF